MNRNFVISTDVVICICVEMTKFLTPSDPICTICIETNDQFAKHALEMRSASNRRMTGCISWLPPHLFG